MTISTGEERSVGAVGCVEHGGGGGEGAVCVRVGRGGGGPDIACSQPH